MKLDFREEIVTPAKAKQLLQQSKDAGFTNRPLSIAIVKKFAHDMAKDQFPGHLTGETIKLSKVNGVWVVIDGQKRLSAIVANNKPQTFWFVYNVPVEMFKHIDGGQPRTLADLMSIDGSPLASHAKTYATTGIMLLKEDQTTDPRKKPDAENTDGTGTQLDYIRNEYAASMAPLCEEHLASLRLVERNGMGAVSLWLYFMVRMSAKDPLLANKVLNYAANYGAVEPCSKNFYFAAKMVQRLREENSESDGTVKKARYKDFIDGVMDAWVLAWNLTREGAHLKKEGAFTAKFNQQHAAVWPGIK